MHRELREIIKEARRLTGMLQGTMALEGQGLDRKTLREMKRRTIRQLLDRRLPVALRVDCITEADAELLQRIATDPNATVGVAKGEYPRCPQRNRIATAEELDDALRESWKQNEEAYRYLADR